MIIIIQQHQFRPGREFIEMIRCELQRNGVKREIWLASYEVFVDFDVEINEEDGTRNFWKITKILTPDGN